MIHVYYGDGKGKTTAGLGLALRAAGRGLSPAIFMFLKDGNTGEVALFQKLGCVDVLCCQTKVQGFFCDMTKPERKTLQTETRQGFFKAQMCAQGKKHGLILLDEIGGCLENGLISEADLLTFLRAFGSTPELVLTGRHFPQSVLDMADYVSEIREIKHPMQQGTPPRLGIEY